MTKIKQFSYKLKGFDFYGLCEVQSIETLPLIVSCTDLYIEGLDDDVKDIVDYQLILDIEDMVRLETENGK
jgi:NAD-dependent DNA ligase